MLKCCISKINNPIFVLAEFILNDAVWVQYVHFRKFFNSAVFLKTHFAFEVGPLAHQDPDQ